MGGSSSSSWIVSPASNAGCSVPTTSQASPAGESCEGGGHQSEHARLGYDGDSSTGDGERIAPAARKAAHVAEAPGRAAEGRGEVAVPGTQEPVSEAGAERVVVEHGQRDEIGARAEAH